MLKGIPEILPPELLKVLCEMGHSDRLVDRKSTRLNSSHITRSRMPSSA